MQVLRSSAHTCLFLSLYSCVVLAKGLMFAMTQQLHVLYYSVEYSN